MSAVLAWICSGSSSPRLGTLYPPTSFVVTKGTSVSLLSDLVQDDNLYFRVTAVSGAAEVICSFTGISSWTNPGQLQLNSLFIAMSTQGPTERVYLFDWAGNFWIEVRNSLAQPTETKSLINIANLVNYVNQFGELKIKVNMTGNIAGLWQMAIDIAQLDA